MELGYAAANIFFVALAKQLKLGFVGTQDDPITTYYVKTNSTVNEKILQGTRWSTIVGLIFIARRCLAHNAPCVRSDLPT